MGKFNIRVARTAILAIYFFTAPVVLAAGPTKKTDKGAATAKDCDALISIDEMMPRYHYLTQSWTLEDLLQTDPKKNLAAEFPTIIMNCDQQDWMVANRYARSKVKDPAYRRSTTWYYPLISAGVPETGGKQIIGHYETIARALDYIKDRANGKRASKMLGFIGPAGTGKTELLDLLEIAKVALANTESDYYQFTFQFTNLKEIEGLEPLTYGANSEGVSPAIKDISLGRSPLVLLPRPLQDRVVEVARDAFRAKTAARGIKMDPLPFLSPTGKTQEVIDAIVAHYQRKEKKESVTVADYIRWLSPHVKIMRRVYDLAKPPAIIRYLGKNPDMQSLFFTENLALSQFFGPNNPLSYSYGLIPSNDNKGLYIDEFFRQGAEVRDSFLDLGQNQTAQNGGAPAERMNTTVYFASNDDSIDEAKQNGGAKAHLSRTIRLPMRHAIEPWLVAKIALMDIGVNRFKQQAILSLTDLMDGQTPERAQAANPPEKIEPVKSSAEARTLELYNPQTVIPDAANGEVAGPDGRYALYYLGQPDEPPILIAPRALWMIGLLGAATRLETDPKAFKGETKGGKREFSTFEKYKQFFTDPKERLNVLIGAKQVENSVALELAKARDLLREGQHGMGARDVENWFSYAIQLARESGNTLTPVTIDRAFAKLLDNQGIENTPAARTKYIELLDMVKAEFILPALSTDVISLIQGHGRAENLYDDIKREMLTISNNPDADKVQIEGNHELAIDRARLAEIMDRFKDISAYEFDVGMIKDFDAQVSMQGGQPRRMPELLEAVRRYLARRELDKTTISQLFEYFNNKPVSEQIRNMGEMAERQLAAHGYNRVAFIQALLFVRDRQFLIDSQARRK